MKSDATHLSALPSERQERERAKRASTGTGLFKLCQRGRGPFRAHAFDWRGRASASRAPGRAGPGRAGPGRAGTPRAVPCRAGPRRAAPRCDRLVTASKRADRTGSAGSGASAGLWGGVRARKKTRLGARLPSEYLYWVGVQLVSHMTHLEP